MTGGVTNGDPAALVLFFVAVFAVFGVLDIAADAMQRRRCRTIRHTCDCGTVTYYAAAARGFARRCTCGRWHR